MNLKVHIYTFYVLQCTVSALSLSFHFFNNLIATLNLITPHVSVALESINVYN